MTDIVQVLPLPDDKYLFANKQGITGIDNKNIPKYTPNGEYEIKASSTAPGKEPYFIANEDDRDYWECKTKTTGYSQSPYLTSDENTSSPYQGGGSVETTWTTPVTNNDNVANVRGEWIQVRIPFNTYIQKYGITTPSYTANNTFPMSIMLVGSNDENEWKQLDIHKLEKDELPGFPNGGSVSKTIEINSTEKFSYFRLIILLMGPNTDKVRINKFEIHGTTMVSHNRKTTKPETFITLSRCNEIMEEDDIATTYDGINMFDRQYAKIKDIQSYSYNLDNAKNNNRNQHTKTQKHNLDYIVTMSIISGALLSGVFAYEFLRRY